MRPRTTPPFPSTPLNTRIASARLCPDLRKHTKAPSGYVAWHEWAETKAETHTQQQCPTCGRWVIWKPKLRLVTP